VAEQRSYEFDCHLAKREDAPTCLGVKRAEAYARPSCVAHNGGATAAQNSAMDTVARVLTQQPT
jgi:hypothetical protein